MSCLSKLEKPWSAAQDIHYKDGFGLALDQALKQTGFSFEILTINRVSPLAGNEGEWTRRCQLHWHQCMLHLSWASHLTPGTAVCPPLSNPPTPTSYACGRKQQSLLIRLVAPLLGIFLRVLFPCLQHSLLFPPLFTPRL